MRTTSRLSRPAFFLAIALMSAWFLLSSEPTVAGIVFNVNMTADVADLNGADNRCDTNVAAGDQCSLRAAISQANSTGGTQDINVPPGIYNLTLPAGDLGISTNMTISGAGAISVVVDADALAAADRVFEVANTATSVLISGLTIRRGTAPLAFARGGGIRNDGTLTLADVVVMDNVAALEGGGIFNQGTLTLVDSDVGVNTAGNLGGGIYNAAGGVLTLTDSNVEENGTGSNIGDNGGGIWNGGALNVNGGTIKDNGAGYYGGGLSNEGVSAEAEITDTQITLNKVGTSGGGAYNTGALSLDGATVTGNESDDDGGGISGKGAISIVGSTLDGNSAVDDGGGIYYTGAGETLVVTDSEITGNEAGGRGGGIYSVSAVLLTDSAVSGNTAGSVGGGINIESAGELTLADSSVSGNAAVDDGGGVWSSGDSSIDWSTISGNTSGDDGGGMAHTGDGVLTMTNSTVSGNEAADTGGGVRNTAVASVSNSTISGNRTDGDGGGIYNQIDDTITIENSTVFDNSADDNGDGFDDGGGIFNAPGGTANLKNTIVAGNHDPTSQPDCSGTLSSLGYNLIEDTTGCTIEGDTTGNVTGEDPLLGPLANNGGPTETHALIEGSPAIDAADPDCPPPDADQRGIARPQDGDGDQEPACDIGAYEALEPAPTPTGTVSTSPTTTASPTATATPTGTPTESPGQHLQGDVDCSDVVDAVDSLKELRYVAALSVSQNEPCPDIGTDVASFWGDVDCSGGVSAVDALKILRYVAALPVQQTEPCADIGTVEG